MSNIANGLQEPEQHPVLATPSPHLQHRHSSPPAAFHGAPPPWQHNARNVQRRSLSSHPAPSLTSPTPFSSASTRPVERHETEANNKAAGTNNAELCLTPERDQDARSMVLASQGVDSILSALESMSSSLKTPGFAETGPGGDVLEHDSKARSMVNKICGGIGCILDALQPELAARANPTCQGDERLLQSFRRSKSRLKSLMAMVEDLCHACQKPGTAARPLLRFPALKPDVIKDFFTPAPQGTELLLGEVFLHSSCGLRPPYPEFALKTKSTIFNKRLVKKGPQRALVMLKAEPASYGTDSIMLYKRLKAIEKGIYRMESNQSSSGNGNSAIPNRNASSEGEHGGISVGTHCQSNSHGARADGNAFSGGEEPSPDTSAADGQPRRFQHGQAPVIDARRLASSTPAETRLVAVGASSSTSAATATDTRAVAKITSGRESGLGFAEGAGAPFGGHSITPFPGSASTAGLPGSMGALSSIDGPGGTPRKVHGQQVVTQATSDLSRMDAIGARGADLKSQGLELQSQDAEVRTAKLNTAIEAPSAELKNQGAKPKRALEPEGAFFEVPLDDQDATLQRRGDISKKSRASLSWSGSRPTRNDC